MVVPDPSEMAMAVSAVGEEMCKSFVNLEKLSIGKPC